MKYISVPFKVEFIVCGYQPEDISNQVKMFEGFWPGPDLIVVF